MQGYHKQREENMQRLNYVQRNILELESRCIGECRKGKTGKDGWSLSRGF